MSDFGVGNAKTRGLCRYTRILYFMKILNKENNSNNIVNEYNTGFLTSPVDVSFIYHVISNGSLQYKKISFLITGTHSYFYKHNLPTYIIIVYVLF